MMQRVRLGVSIHAPAKGATLLSISFLFLESFQSTLPRRERPIEPTAKVPQIFGFNPRSREGSDESLCLFVLQPRCFNPRSREGSDRLLCADDLPFLRFNPRSREGSDTSDDLYDKIMGVSIHAPAKGATKIRSKSGGSGFCFNPRSREGSDSDILIHLLETTSFNPRSREGSDVFYPHSLQSAQVSIHAPAKGATRLDSKDEVHDEAFQSTLPRRERQALIRREECLRLRFQSTLPRRERPGTTRNRINKTASFNPRSREGSD